MINKINFLTAKQVSEYLQMPLRTVQYLSHTGKIKAIKIGNKWKYNKEDIEKYVYFGTDFSKEPSRIYNNFIERRIHPRINTNFRCQYSINLPPFKEINSLGIIQNLSAGGILLINQDKGINEIDLNDPIDLDFSLIIKDKTLNIKTKGRIVRKDGNKFGIKFRDIKEEDRTKIVQYVG